MGFRSLAQRAESDRCEPGVRRKWSSSTGVAYFRRRRCSPEPQHKGGHLAAGWCAIPSAASPPKSREPRDKDGDENWLRLDLLLNVDALENPDPALKKLFKLAKGPKHPPTSEQLVDLACDIYNGRRLRNRFLNDDMLGEPVWDMLLALYCFGARGENLSVSALCQSAGVPATTALRWENIMEQKGLIERQRDKTDARRVFMSLTDKAKAMMDEYLSIYYAGRKA